MGYVQRAEVELETADAAYDWAPQQFRQGMAASEELPLTNLSDSRVPEVA
jgi:hypothetical protein